MISYEQALSLVLSQDLPVDKENVTLNNAVGRICAETISAPFSIQAFDNSAMDGFAVREEDLQTASLDTPRRLKVTERIAAGPINANLQLAPGQCMEIMTGAAIPKACSAVVPIEHVTLQGHAVSFSAPIKPEANIRRSGEDFKQGDLILSSGDIIQPHHILVLASFGIEKLNVRQRLKVACLSTGNEVIRDFSQNLKYGEIYDSTGPYLQQRFKQYRADVKHYGVIQDTPSSLKTTIKQALANGCQIIVSTGGVSAGRYDFIKTVLEGMDAEVLFHKTAVRPGKPILFAKFKNGSLFFGLPGNPLSTVCGLDFFILPLLRKLNQQPKVASLQCIAQNNFIKKNNFRWFLLGKLHLSPTSNLTAEIISKQQSFMTRPLLQANTWVVLPEQTTGVMAGDSIEVFPFFLESFQATDHNLVYVSN